MAKVVKKAQSSSRVVLKAATSGSSGSKKVDSQRPITTLEQMGDVNFGSLDSSKDNLIVSYDSNTDKFILISADQMLSSSVEDLDLPDDFITQVENELDLGNIQLDNLDGGGF
jgi:hypothetical protein